MSLFAQTCGCRGVGADDLMPVLVAAAILVGYPFAGKWLRTVKGKKGMNSGKNMAIIVALVVAVGAVMWLKQEKRSSSAVGKEMKGDVESVASQGSALPRLVDLGAGKCIPCKMMAPILEDLKKTCAGKLDVIFIDVWQNPDAGKQYGINLIPTQIFFGADGKERFRHEGFFSKEDILGKWKELGVGL